MLCVFTFGSEDDGYTEIGDVSVSQPRPQRQSVQVVHIRKTETG